MTMRIFHEPTPGMVAHTKTSKALQNSILNDWVKCGTHEMWPAAIKDFSLANGTTEPIYTVLEKEPERAILFANAMKVYTIKPEYNVSHLLHNYDWASLGHSRVVDVGGSQGHVAVELAKRFHNLSVIVQDIAPVVENLQAGLPREIEGRLHFMAHDYFQPQTVEADVYFFRWVLHNLSDAACYKILRALIAILKPGIKIILQDLLMPEPGAVPLWRDKDLRSSDIHMTTLFNAKERMVEEWKAMISEADPRYILTRVIEPKGSALGILELVWKA